MADHRGIELKSVDQLRQMRRAGLVVGRALEAMAAACQPGLTTAELNDLAVEALAREKATSSFLGYDPGWAGGPFPGVVCVSINQEVVHGLPSPERVLATGDLVSIDFGAVLDGWHGDSAVSVEVGPVAPAVARLNQVTRQALWAGLAAARLGGRVSDISAAVEASVRSQKERYGLLRDYTGHGIGSAMHQEPDVPNYGRPGRGPALVEGLCLAIEPMLTLGSRRTAVLEDGWTVVTADDSCSAHWEHTMTVTKHGLWVLTALDGGEAELNRLGLPFGPLSD